MVEAAKPSATRGLAEALGSMLLAATVIGSGIMAERLAGGNAAVALLANTLATVAALAVLIAALAPVSGAHFNPAVTLTQWIARRLTSQDAVLYLLCQLAGCCAGAWLAHAMFELPVLQVGTKARTGWAQGLSEFVATAGLIWVVLTAPSVNQAAWRVPLWIGAAYWFTASTSFANPAITIARGLTDSFAGIAPSDVPAFIGAQLAGAVAGLGLARVLR